jgi:hypothetical protein
MSLFETCYDTTYGSIYSNSIQKTKNAILESIRFDDYLLDKDPYSLGTIPVGFTKNVFLTNRNELNGEEAIPIFSHPLYIDAGKNKYLFSDMRMLMRSIPNGDLYSRDSDVEKRIKNLPEYNFNRNRAVLSNLFISKTTTGILNDLKLACRVMCSLMSNNIAKAYNLDYRQKMLIEIMTSFYYYDLFFRPTDDSEEYMLSSIIHTIKLLKLPEPTVRSVVDILPKHKDKIKIGNITEYCDAIKLVLDDRKLSGFNLGVLLTLLSSSWFGNNYKELLSCGVEHPPTWISIVALCASDRSYKSSTIFNIINNLPKSETEDFLKKYSVILNTAISSTGM